MTPLPPEIEQRLQEKMQELRTARIYSPSQRGEAVHVGEKTLSEWFEDTAREILQEALGEKNKEDSDKLTKLLQKCRNEIFRQGHKLEDGTRVIGTADLFDTILLPFFSEVLSSFGKGGIDWSKKDMHEGLGMKKPTALKESAGGEEKKTDNRMEFGPSESDLKSVGLGKSKDWRVELREALEQIVMGDSLKKADAGIKVFEIFEAQESRHRKEILELRKELGKSYDSNLETIDIILKNLS